MQDREIIHDIIAINGPDAQRIFALVEAACARCHLHYRAHTSATAPPAPVILRIDTGIPAAKLSPRHPHWLVADLDHAAREAAFMAGYSRIIPTQPSEAELDCCLRALHDEQAGNLLLTGMGEFSNTISHELAGPLHYMSLGLRAMNQELLHLKPLFDDLHKAWFKADKDLLEKLRLILSVINLQQSWTELERTLLDYENGLVRLRDIHNFLRLGSQIESKRIRQISLDELTTTCLNLLTEGRSDGIKISEEVPVGLFIRLPVGIVFFGFLKLLAALLEGLIARGSGRGTLSISVGPAENEHIALAIEAKPEKNSKSDKPMEPDLSWARFILEDLGVRFQRQSQGAAILLTVLFPKDLGEID